MGSMDSGQGVRCKCTQRRPIFYAAELGDVGVLGEVTAGMVGGPVAALLLAEMKRDWSLEGCNVRAVML